MVKVSKCAVNDKGKGTTKIIDEFFQEHVRRTQHGIVTVIKAKRTFGRIGLEHMRQCVTGQYRKCAASFPLEFETADECFNQFYVDKCASIVKAIDDGKINDDRSFDKQVTVTASRWFLGLYEKTEFGKKRDMLRNRMSRDAKKRFVNVGSNNWGLADGPKQPSTRHLLELKLIALQYPVDLDYSKIADPNRRKEPSYGTTGQLEDLIEGVLEAAEGTLTLTNLLRIVQYRVAPLQVPDVISLNTNPESPIDVPDENAIDPSEVASEWDNLKREQLMDALTEEFASLKGASLAKRRSEMQPVLVRLLGEAAIRK